jgi:hypothetical protein
VGARAGVACAGVVVATHATRTFGQLWRVRHDADGAEEELNWTGLKEALRNAERGGAGGARAPLSPPPPPPLPQSAPRSFLPPPPPPPAAARRPAAPPAPRAPKASTTAATAAAAAAAATTSEDGTGAADSDDDKEEEEEEEEEGGAPAPRVRYKGVSRDKQSGTLSYRMRVKLRCATAEGGVRIIRRGGFASAADAARAYDTVARAAGLTAVNFPRRGSREVLAPPRRSSSKKKKKKAAAAAEEEAAEEEEPVAPAAPPPPPARPLVPYRGVTALLNGRFAAHACAKAAGLSVYLGSDFVNAEAAAHACDAVMRARGVRVVNFPRPGSTERQASKKCHVGKADVSKAQPRAKHAARAAAEAVSTVLAAKKKKKKRAREDGDDARAAAQAAPACAPAAKAPRAGSGAPAVAPPPLPPPPPSCLASFLRAMQPALSPPALSTALGALPSSGLSLAHLRGIVVAHAGRPDDLKTLTHDAAEVLGIVTGADRLAFRSAVMRLAARGAGGGSAV